MSTPPIPGRWPVPGTVVDIASTEIRYENMLRRAEELKRNSIRRGKKPNPYILLPKEGI